MMTNGKRIFDYCKVDAVYTSCPYMIQYITGFVAENGMVVIDADGTTLYTDKRYIESAEKCFVGTEVTATLYTQAEVLERLKGYASVGISFREISHEEFLALENAGVRLVNIDEPFQNAMENKNEWELGNIAKACEIAEDAFNALLPQIQEGMTETEVAALLEYEMRRRGAQGVSFETIVAFGAHASVPHYETGLTRLQFGDEILIDFGCKVNGYCSDITRTFLFGDDGKHEAFKQAYEAVLGAHELVKEKVVGGMTGGEADAIAREYLTAKGYGHLFIHSLGHGIGLNIHEFPRVTKNSTEVLTDGMVFSNEPGVYVAGEYGIRIEDTVALKNGKIHSFMSKTDKKLIIL